MTTLTFDQNVVTPEGTPLGGWVHLEVSDNGDFYVKFHMHSSSMFGNFDYNLRAYLTAPGFPTMAFIQSGHVSGVDDWEHEERGNNPLLHLYWAQLQAGPIYNVAKDYSWGGPVGTINELVKDIFDIGAGVVGTALGVIVGATREAIDWLGTTLGPGGTLGVIGGVVVFAVATVAGAGVGGALILAVVAGVAIGAVTNALIEYRALNAAEVALARKVFGNSLNFDKVVITNLAGAGGRAFTAPGVDGKTYCNLGHAYDNPLGSGGDAYPYPGQLLIHELTHAWQIEHTSFLPGLMCSGMVNQAQYTLGDNVYAYGAPGGDWSTFNAEQQGAIVDQWYGGNHNSARHQPMDQESPYYRYIWDNILGHANSSSAPANLRSAASSGVAAIGRSEGHLDVFWVGQDGAIGSQWWDAARGAGWGDHTAFAIAPYWSAQQGSAVTCVARTPNNLDVFWVGYDGAIATQWWAAGDHGQWGDHTAFAIAPPGSARPGSAIAAVARTPDHIDVFWIAPDGAIASHWWDAAAGGGWGNHGPFPIAPAGSADPEGGLSVVSRSPNHMDVFWIGPDGGIGSQWWDATPGWGWGDHTAFGIAPPGSARQGSPITAVARTPDHLDVFWVGRDGAIASQWWDAAAGAGWGDHQPFRITPPGAAAPDSGLAAVTRTPDHLDVFWVGSDGAVGSQWWHAAQGANWGDHTPFPITPAGAADPRSPLTAVGRTPDHLDVFWVGPDGAIASQWWDVAAGAGWGDHQPFPITGPGAGMSTDTSRRTSTSGSVTRNPNHLDVFWVGADGAIASQWWDAAPGASWGDHQAFPITQPGAAEPGTATAVVSRSPNHLDVFWVGADGAIASQWWDATAGASWGDHQPFTITSPGAAKVGSSVTAVARYANHLDVFWVGADGAVISQWWDAAPGLGWGDHQPFALTPPGVADPTAGIAAVARTRDHLDVFWVSPDGSILSQWWDAAPGAGWGDHNAFAVASPGSAHPGSPVAVVARYPGHLDVFWVGPDGAVASTWWDIVPGAGWGDHSPFPISAPGAADPTAGLAVVSRTRDHLDVFWVGPDGAIGSQWWDGAPGAGWGDHNAFPITPPGSARAGSPISAVTRYPNHLDVFWTGPDGAVGSQWWDGGPGAGWGDHQPFPITSHGAETPRHETLHHITQEQVASVIRGNKHLDA